MFRGTSSSSQSVEFHNQQHPTAATTGTMTEDEGARWLLVNVKGGVGIDWGRAFPAGFEADGRPLYVCRAALTHDGQPSDALLKVHPHRARHGEVRKPREIW